MIIVAQFGLLLLLFLLLLLHVMILMKFIPYHFVWGGRLKNDKEMYRFEGFSILLNSVFIIVVLMRIGVLDFHLSRTISSYGLWLMAGMFLLSTAGNVMSKNGIEKWFFTPVTLLLAAFSFILALSN
jgi:hypothetical protein